MGCDVLGQREYLMGQKISWFSGTKVYMRISLLTTHMHPSSGTEKSDADVLVGDELEELKRDAELELGRKLWGDGGHHHYGKSLMWS